MGPQGPQGDAGPAGADGYRYFAEQILGSPQQEITLPGLDGDTDGAYEIWGHGPSELGALTLRWNSTMSTDYSTLYLGGSVATTYWGYMGNVHSAFRAIVYCKTGARRSAFCMSHQDSGAADMYLGNARWTDTAANVTSIGLVGAVAGQFKAGFSVWIRSVKP